MSSSPRACDDWLDPHSVHLAQGLAMKALQRRTVLVTGGANGIGWAISERFAAAGDRVVIADIDEDMARNRAAALGKEHLALAVDMADPGSVTAMVRACLDTAGGLDVLVNNAGVLEAVPTPFIEQTIEDAARVLAVNVSGALLACERAADHFRAQGGGVIINLASCAGLAAVPARSAYGASKAAIAGMTRSMAMAWASLGVRVNSVSPGYTLTELNQRLIDSGKLKVEALNRRVPLGRMAMPAEMAAVVFHLASDDAGFMTGANIIADGGLMAFGGLGAASREEAPMPTSGRRTVMVAGVCGAIGRALARRFAALGDRVIAVDADLDQAKQAFGDFDGDHLPLAYEPGDESSLRNALAAAVEAFGPLDIFITSPQTEAHEPDEGRSGYLLETLLLTKVAGAHLAPGASVVLLAPGGTTHGGHAAQSGVAMLARSLACEWASSGVRVNAVVHDRPGPGQARTLPLGRPLDPEDIASAALFLGSSAASYVTGATIPVDGGRWATSEVTSPL